MPSETWTSWLDRHGPALVLLARQYVVCRSDAEDIVQEAFVRFWRRRSAANDHTAYLYACVRGCALEWLRGKKRQIRREEAVAKWEAVENDWLTAPEVQAERCQAIERALKDLPELQREVLVLKIWGGLTFQQIAQTLDIPMNTAASRYRYALEKMREQLAEEPIR